MLLPRPPATGRRAVRPARRRRAPRAPALDEGEGSGDHRHHERGRDDREQAAQTPGPAPRALELAVLGVPARLQELAFDAGELPLLARAARAPPRDAARGRDRRRRVPLSSHERAAVVSCRRVRSSSRSSASHPRSRGHSRISASWAISAESSPTTRSRAPASCSSTAVASSPRLALRDQLRQRDSPPGVLRRLAQLGELEEHPPHEHLLLLDYSPGRPPRPCGRSRRARRRPRR